VRACTCSVVRARRGRAYTCPAWRIDGSRRAVRKGALSLGHRAVLGSSVARRNEVYASPCYNFLRATTFCRVGVVDESDVDSRKQRGRGGGGKCM
jgi:hypothetical protein